MTNLDHAKRYVKLGWSVIPVKNKIPQLTSWKEYQTRLPTEEELQSWFKDPTMGIGIVTGVLSQLSVVDVDSKTILSLLQSPVAVLTPRGRHYYFRYSEGVKNSVKILENVDIRSEGGFVCAPPTPGYKFLNPYFSLSQLPEFPGDFLPTEEKPILKNGSGWISEALTNLKEGNRDDTFVKVIGRLSYDGYASDDIIALLTPYAETSGFGIASLNNKVKHILGSYQNNKIAVETSQSDSLETFLQDIKPIEWIVPNLIGRGTIGFIAGLPETLKTWIAVDLAIECSRGGHWLGRFKVEAGRVLFIDQERYKGLMQRRFQKLLGEKSLNPKELDLHIQCGTTTRLDLEESFNAFRKCLSELRPRLVIIDSFTTFHTKEENNRRDIQIVLERIKQLRQEFGCTFLFIDHENKSVFDKEDTASLPNAFKMVGSVGKPAAAETVFVVRKISENEVVLYHVKSTIAPTIEPVKLKIIDTAKGVLLS